MTDATPTKTICVFCGSAFGRNPNFTQQAAKLGELLANNNYGLVYGGGTTGLMGVIAKNASLNEGYVHGIIPDALVSKERADDGKINERNEEMSKEIDHHKDPVFISEDCGKTTIVPDMHTRKQLMSQEADGGFVAMPGGFGTLEEIMEITTWSQLGIHCKPIVLFNIDGFYDDFIKFLKTAIEKGFISRKNGDIIAVATTPEEVIKKLDNYIIPEGRFQLKWDKK